MTDVTISITVVDNNIVSITLSGVPGQGVPVGGSAGQYLKKSTAVDYATEWVSITAGGGSGDVSWGAISGTISNQTDLINRIAPVATSTVSGMQLYNTGTTTYWASQTSVNVAWGAISGTIGNQTDLINRITPVVTSTVSGRMLYNTGTTTYWASQTAVTGFETTIASGTVGYWNYTKTFTAISLTAGAVGAEPAIVSGTAGFWNYAKTFTAVTGFEPTIASGTAGYWLYTKTFGAISFPVTSVNSLTGAVSLTASVVGAEPVISSGTTGYWNYTKTFTALSFPVTSVNGQTGVVSIPADVANVAWGAISGTIGNQTDLINRIAPVVTSTVSGMLLYNTGTTTYWASATAVSGTTSLVQWGNVSGTISNQTDLINRITPVVTSTVSGMMLYNTGTANYWASQTAVSGFEPTIASGTAGYWLYTKTFGAISVPAANVAWGAISGTIGNQTDLINRISPPPTSTVAGMLLYNTGTTTYWASATAVSGTTSLVQWGNISGTISNQTDLINKIAPEPSATTSGQMLYNTGTTTYWASQTAVTGFEPTIASGTAGYWLYTKTFGAISVPAANVAWGAISGTIGNQTDLINRITPVVTSTVSGMMLYNTGTANYWASQTAVTGFEPTIASGTAGYWLYTKTFGAISFPVTSVNSLTGALSITQQMILPPMTSTVIQNILYNTGTTAYWGYQLKALYFGVDNGATTITTGLKTQKLTIPYNCTLRNWYMTADTIGNCLIDVLFNSLTMIGAGNYPALSNVVRQTASITSWSLSTLSIGAELQFNVLSATVRSVTLMIQVSSP